MPYLVLFFFLIVNSLISFLNAYGAGAMYSEAKAIGGWTRAVNVSALIMAACGWSWVILTIETIIIVLTGRLEPGEAQAMFNLGWLFLAIPIIGSGFVLWANSLVRAFKTRKVGDIMVGGWNTFAQFHNVYSVAKNAPGAIDSVIKAFSKSKDGRNLLLILILVIIALGGGILITIAIARWSDRKNAIAVDGND